jgi:glycoside/pentoside/hexuronide:cation symporter, GPH family
MSSSERLRVGTKLGFGVGAIAEGAIYIAFNTWNFLFYNQVLGLSGTLAGLAVTFSLVLDGICEPIVGSLSDRWRSKLGRRHPFLFAAPIPLAITFFLLYAPPSGLSGFPLFLWFTVFATLHRQALTLYQIPHLALGAELSNDYHQRSIVMSYSALFAVIGGAGTYFYGWTWFSKHAGGSTARENYLGLALGVALIAAVTIFVSAWTTKDQIPRLRQANPDAPRFSLGQLWHEIRDCLQNANYRTLLLGLFALSATVGVLETLLSYVNLFFWHFSEKTIRGFGLASPPAFVLAFFFAVRLHRKFDKRKTLVGALWLTAIVVVTPISLRLLGLYPATPQGAFPLQMLATFLYYCGSAVLMITVLSALADVADEHELNTGRRQEGIFYAARTFFSKLSTGLGHILAGLAIDIIQFPTHAKPGEVAADVVAKLGFVTGPLAVLPTLVAIYFYRQYAIDRKRHAEIQQALAARHGARAQSEAGQAADAAPGPIEPAPI